MKILSITVALALGTSILLIGCAGTSNAPDSDFRHPAHANAEASPMPPLETGLLSLTNVAAQPNSPQPEPENQQGHKK